MIEALESPAESARFGYPTARLSLRAEDHSDHGQAVAKALADTDAVIVIVRYPSESPRALATSGSDLEWACFPGGSVMHWRAPASLAELPPADGFHSVAEDAIPALREVVLDSFAGYVNHYSANPLIPLGVTTEGYAQWADALARTPGNPAFGIRDPDGLVAAGLVDATGEAWDVALAGVARRARRRGHYRALLSGIVREAAAAGMPTTISTQSHNVAVQRAWIELGFLPTHSVETVHLVRRSQLSRPG